MFITFILLGATLFFTRKNNIRKCVMIRFFFKQVLTRLWEMTGVKRNKFEPAWEGDLGGMLMESK
jgi:hypothetical protein